MCFSIFEASVVEINQIQGKWYSHEANSNEKETPPLGFIHTCG